MMKRFKFGVAWGKLKICQEASSSNVEKEKCMKRKIRKSMKMSSMKRKREKVGNVLRKRVVLKG